MLPPIGYPGSPTAGEAGRFSLPALAEAMSSPRFYPHRPRSVQFIQTHISMIFIAGDLVYKVKKTVDFGFVDYSTLGRRGRWCRREVTLNRRLAPDLYVGVVKIYRRGEVYSLTPPGRVVEYAVLMKRLPSARLLSHLMRTNRATRSQLRRVARRVASFHLAQPALAATGRRGRLLAGVLEENLAGTAPYVGSTVRPGDYRVVRDYNRTILAERAGLFEKRLRDGRHRDCHGDLRAEHICLVDGIVIFDGLEFSPRLRQGDVAAEIAFLYMDLLHHRHPHLAKAFAEEYIRATGDWEIRLLLPFFACYRAVVREKVENLRSLDDRVPRRERSAARRRAAGYFRFARFLAERDGRPRLVIVGGLPGSGKSRLAGEWAARTGAVTLRSDVLRRELARRAGGTSGAGGFREGIYSAAWTERVYDEMIRRAELLLERGRSVALDATFHAPAQRRRAAAAARRTGADFVAAECRSPERIVRERLQRRQREGRSVSEAGWQIYRSMKKVYRPPSRKTAVLRTDRDPEAALAKIAEAAYPC